MKVSSKVKKRDQSLVKFDKSKIKNAIFKAAYEVLRNHTKAQSIALLATSKALERIGKLYKNKIPTIEGIQDIVEEVLMQEGFNHVAKAYIIYRHRHHDFRHLKSLYGVKDDLKLPINTVEVLKRRYLLKDDEANTIETPSELFRRAAHHIAGAEANFKTRSSLSKIEEEFYQAMRNREFMPNSPTLMNAGTSLGQLSACFVLPVQDSMESIFSALKDMAIIHQTGGGTGFSFSQLRPKGDLVYSTKGEASGPVSFMSIFDKATGVIVQGGRRRGANMGILRCDHPDIVEFIEAKSKEEAFSNFNLSIGVTDKFMEAVIKNKKFDLVNPRTKRTTQSINARSIFDLMVHAAWKVGDPGIVFLDEINRAHPLRSLGQIEATNPCGELPLLAFESCNLGSINLATMVEGKKLNFSKLKRTVWMGIRFLDNVIEVNKFPLSKIKETTLANRKIGLGVMGFADMLIKLGIGYDSQEAITFAAKLMKFIHTQSLKASLNLARERGVFANFKKSTHAKKNMRLRNATVNTIAPTGTISIIAGCSSSIEPLFAINFIRNVLSGMQLFEVNSLFAQAAKKSGIYSKEILAEVAKQGSLKELKAIPSSIRKVFVTAFDVSARQHLEIQAAFQKYTDNAVSKTINLAADATVEDVRKIYLLAYRLKCKGITIYRYGSKAKQVLSFGYQEARQPQRKKSLVTAGSEYSGGCPVGACPF